tara:strand:+ start:688 stop:1632 length:945 start_codon:yes stop_codon:yes gene_type:complete
MKGLIKRNLVTGGAGFLGSHLVDNLLENGEEVVCLDNYSTGNKANIEKWIGHKRFEMIRHDITLPIQLEIDQIWHLACPASPVHYQSNPIKTAKTIFLGTFNMLGLARRLKAKILLASTSEVYGDSLVHPQSEDYWGNVNPIGIRSCYDEGKRLAEALCVDYERMHNVDIRIMRIFNTYGPRMLPNDGRVISNFVVQALQGEPLTVYGDGKQTRSFCFVDDLINGMMLLMNSSHTGPINIGNPDEFSILKIAEIIRSKINPKLEILHRPLPSDDPSRRKPNILLAKKYLNWEPNISFNDGIDKTIDYFIRKLAK